MDESYNDTLSSYFWNHSCHVLHSSRTVELVLCPLILLVVHAHTISKCRCIYSKLDVHLCRPFPPSSYTLKNDRLLPRSSRCDKILKLGGSKLASFYCGGKEQAETPPRECQDQTQAIDAGKCRDLVRPSTRAEMAASQGKGASRHHGYGGMLTIDG